MRPVCHAYQRKPREEVRLDHHQIGTRGLAAGRLPLESGLRTLADYQPCPESRNGPVWRFDIGHPENVGLVALQSRNSNI
jgi:hypothetical protein